MDVSHLRKPPGPSDKSILSRGADVALPQRVTAAQCDELVEALLQGAAALPDGSERENLLKLAAGYHDLANMKRIVDRNVN
jgi:hypothetical protein